MSWGLGRLLLLFSNELKKTLFSPLGAPPATCRRSPVNPVRRDRGEVLEGEVVLGVDGEGADRGAGMGCRSGVEGVVGRCRSASWLRCTTPRRGCDHCRCPCRLRTRRRVAPVTVAPSVGLRYRSGAGRPAPRSRRRRGLIDGPRRSLRSCWRSALSPVGRGRLFPCCWLSLLRRQPRW